MISFNENYISQQALGRLFPITLSFVVGTKCFLIFRPLAVTRYQKSILIGFSHSHSTSFSLRARERGAKLLITSSPWTPQTCLGMGTTLWAKSGRRSPDVCEKQMAGHLGKGTIELHFPTGHRA